jgi:acetaldehyde dehydrogenase (acetylating)
MTPNAAKTRWGIVGTGPMAAEFAAGLAILPDASLVAVGSRSSASARAFAGRLGLAKSHGSYEALMADPEVDVVYIATVNTSHRDLCHEASEVMRCLREGLVESPILPLDETVAILETTDELRRQWGLRYPVESRMHGR